MSVQVKVGPAVLVKEDTKQANGKSNADGQIELTLYVNNVANPDVAVSDINAAETTVVQLSGIMAPLEIAQAVLKGIGAIHSANAKG